MEGHYKTLQTIYDITRDDPNPETYKCRPREIILRQYQSWTTIEKHLKLLKDEGMIVIIQEDTIVIFITKAGIEKVSVELREAWKMN
jgi:DNA-binding transcriptional ArsR family regulator